MKPKHQRLLFLLVSVAFLCVAVVMALRSFRDSMVFFYTPSELPGKTLSTVEILRVGGQVVPGSVAYDTGNKVTFDLTDVEGEFTLTVTYHGILPGMFRSGQGAVVEGKMTGSNHFEATRVLTKHDEKYMPKEVVDDLKRVQLWYNEGWEENIVDTPSSERVPVPAKRR